MHHSVFLNKNSVKRLTHNEHFLVTMISFTWIGDLETDTTFDYRKLLNTE